jgi:short-subunit dehydrogenase
LPPLKTAVITGGGSGLGYAFARQLSERRYKLALIDIDKDRLEESARGLPNVTTHCLDIADEAALGDAASAIATQHGRVNLLINNAAISISAPFEGIPSQAFQRLMLVNFNGLVYSCRAFLPLLRAEPKAQILNVASSFAWVGYPGKTAYAASKGAIRSFSESLRHELAPDGIGVTLLYPGPVRTNIARASSASAREVEFLDRRGLDPQKVARKALDALGRNPSRIVIGGDYRLMDALARFSPQFAGWVVGRIARRLRF